MGMTSQGSIESARGADFQTERITYLKNAQGQALAANIMFGAAGAAAVGALFTLLIPGGQSAPAPAPSMGGSP
jgi:hypothetical protein